MKRSKSNNDQASKKTKISNEELPKFDPKQFAAIPEELLIDIFRFVPSATLTKSLVFVSKKFHEIIYNPQNDLFHQIFILFPSKKKIPNFSLIKSLRLENVEKKHDADLKQLNHVERLHIPIQEDLELLKIIDKYFKNLKYLHYGYLLNDEFWEFLKKLPNLEVLKVVDLDETEFKGKLNSLTDLEVNMDYSYATYGYDENGPLNFNKTFKSIFNNCPKLEKIQFHAESFYIDLDCLFKIVYEFSKQLKLVTLSILEDVFVENANQVEKVDFDCSFLNVRANKTMAIVLKYLFPNCDITILEDSIRGKKITKELLEKRKILKNKSDLEALNELLTKSNEGNQDDDEEDEEEDDGEDENEGDEEEDDGM